MSGCMLLSYNLGLNHDKRKKHSQEISVSSDISCHVTEKRNWGGVGGGGGGGEAQREGERERENGKNEMKI